MIDALASEPCTGTSVGVLYVGVQGDDGIQLSCSPAALVYLMTADHLDTSMRNQRLIQEAV